MRDDRDKAPLAKMLLIGFVASAIGVAIALAIDWFPDAATDRSNQIDTLYDVLLIVSVPVFVLVMTAAIYSVMRFRARPGDMSDGEPIHGNTKLEVIWVAIPTVIVSILAAYGWIVLNDIEEKRTDEMQVRVVAQQFAWKFEYTGAPQGKVVSDVLYLPVDQPVKFDVVTLDVLHAFWVPQFRLKTDTVPGLTTRVRLTPNKIGEFDVVCTELCGLGHATMRQDVHVMSRADFDDWLAKQKPAPKDGDDAPEGGATPGESASARPTIPAPAG